MFNLSGIIGWKNYDFGKRMITSDKFSSTMAIWFRDYRRYFPYIITDNPGAVVIAKDINGNPAALPYDKCNNDQDINKTDYYVTEFKIGNSSYLSMEGDIRDAYKEYMLKLTRGLRPNMTDLDKYMLAYWFTVGWLSYGETIDPYLSHLGVCADYGNLFSLSLNVLGVDAMPMESKYDAPLTHQIVWSYMDIDGDGVKKWYGSNLTNGDSWGYKDDFSSTMPRKHVQMESRYLFDVAKSQFVTANNDVF